MKVRLPAFLCFGLLGGIGLAHAEMNLNVDKMSTNGMEVRKLSCKLESGGLFGTITIVGELAKHKPAFDACASAGAAFATQFTWRNGKTSDVKVTASSNPKANTCIADTLKKTNAAVVGTCSAILLTGDKAKAEAAAEALIKAK